MEENLKLFLENLCNFMFVTFPIFQLFFRNDISFSVIQIWYHCHSYMFGNCTCTILQKLKWHLKIQSQLKYTFHNMLPGIRLIQNQNIPITFSVCYSFNWFYSAFQWCAMPFIRYVWTCIYTSTAWYDGKCLF